MMGPLEHRRLSQWAVMVNDGFHDDYRTKAAALKAAKNLRAKGERARVERVPADLRGDN